MIANETNSCGRSPDRATASDRRSPSQVSSLEPQASSHQVTVTRDDRRYRVRGLAKNTSYDQMKINLMVTRDGALHVDTLDLYDARRRITFCKQAADELFVDEATVKQDLGHLLLELEERQNELIESALAFKSETPYRMTEVEEAAARQLLESPDLMDRIADDFQTCGVVGEQTNKPVTVTWRRPAASCPGRWPSSYNPPRPRASRH
jgi:hypothetical protein